MTEENPTVTSVAQDLRGDQPSDEERLDEAAAAGAAGADGETTPETDPQEEDPEAGTPEEREEFSEVETPAMARLRAKDQAPRKLTKKQQKEEREAVKQALKPSSTLPRSAGALRDLVPGSEKLKVHLSKPGEKSILVGIFAPRDIPTNQDAETFIYNKLRHKGSGTYELTVVDANRRAFPAGEVELDVGDGTDLPTSVAGGTSVNDLMSTMLMRDGEERKQLAKELANVRSKPDADPIDMLGRMHDLQEKVTPDNKGNDGTLATMIQTMSQQSQNFMQMMMEHQAKSEERMALLTAPKESVSDKILVALLPKLLEDKGSSSSEKLPTPPAPLNPIEDFKNMAEVFVMMQPKEGNNLMLEYLIKKDERNEAREGGGGGTDDFKKAMENFNFMMGAVQNFRQQIEPGGATGFFDALGAFFQSGDLPSSIASAIRTKTALAARQGVVASSAAPTAPRLVAGKERISEEELNRRRQIVHQRRVEIAQQKLQTETDALEQEAAELQQPDVTQTAPEGSAPAVQAQPVAQQPPVQSEGAAAVSTVTEQEAVEATERVVAQEGEVPDMPPDIGDHINNMLAAQDDGALVECVVRLLQYLSELPYWEKFANTVFVMMQKGDQPRVLETIRAFFRGLEKLGYVSPTLTNRVAKVFDLHFAEIVTHTRKAIEEEKAEAEAEEEEAEAEAEAGGNDVEDEQPDSEDDGPVEDAQSDPEADAVEGSEPEASPGT